MMTHIACMLLVFESIRHYHRQYHRHLWFSFSKNAMYFCWVMWVYVVTQTINRLSKSQHFKLEVTLILCC